MDAFLFTKETKNALMHTCQRLSTSFYFIIFLHYFCSYFKREKPTKRHVSRCATLWDTLHFACEPHFWKWILFFRLKINKQLYRMGFRWVKFKKCIWKSGNSLLVMVVKRHKITPNQASAKYAGSLTVINQPKFTCISNFMLRVYQTDKIVRKEQAAAAK